MLATLEAPTDPGGRCMGVADLIYVPLTDGYIYGAMPHSKLFSAVSALREHEEQDHGGMECSFPDVQLGKAAIRGFANSTLAMLPVQRLAQD